MPTVQIRLGAVAATYYKVGGVNGGGNWTELTNIRDATLNLETGEADVTTRANAGWEASVPTLKKASVDFEMIWDPLDAGFAAIQAAFFAGTKIGIRAMDAKVGQGLNAQGLQADMAVSKFSVPQPLNEAQKVSVTVKPTYSDVAPEWLKNQ